VTAAADLKSMTTNRNNKAQGKLSMSQDLAVVLQSIQVIDDHDWGAGDIVIKYNANDGFNSVSGELEEYQIDSGETQPLGVRIATFDDVDDLIALNVAVWDIDSGWDDNLGPVNVSYGPADNFGIGTHTLPSETGDYNLTFSIVTV
jgi:hypothetical protein